MQIRAYQTGDEEQIAALWTRVFGYPQAHNEPHRVIREKLAVKDDLFYVAAREGRIVGTVMGGYDGHRGWIYSMAVDLDARRQGIGSALMRHVEAALRARGCAKINLQVIASNADAVRFYQQAGYTIEERVSMGKLLRSA
jgi:ribosomal protein S18 acetylase RimI-like enzyme